MHPDQMQLNLFNEVEVLATQPPKEQITYECRKQTDKRETDLEKLPVETGTHELGEAEQFCVLRQCTSRNEHRDARNKGHPGRSQSRAACAQGICLPPLRE